MKIGRQTGLGKQTDRHTGGQRLKNERKCLSLFKFGYIWVRQAKNKNMDKPTGRQMDELMDGRTYWGQTGKRM